MTYIGIMTSLQLCTMDHNAQNEINNNNLYKSQEQNIQDNIFINECIDSFNRRNDQFKEATFPALLFVYGRFRFDQLSNMEVLDPMVLNAVPRLLLPDHQQKLQKLSIQFQQQILEQILNKLITRHGDNVKLLLKLQPKLLQLKPELLYILQPGLSQKQIKQIQDNNNQIALYHAIHK